jgi:hypothetical protein
VLKLHEDKQSRWFLAIGAVVGLRLGSGAGSRAGRGRLRGFWQPARSGVGSASSMVRGARHRGARHEARRAAAKHGWSGWVAP